MLRPFGKLRAQHRSDEQVTVVAGAQWLVARFEATRTLCPLPTAHCPLPTAHYFAGGATRTA